MIIIDNSGTPPGWMYFLGLTKKENNGILIFEIIEERIRMRLTGDEAAAIKESVYAFDPDAKIYLFGSRTDDTKKGGDIDLFVISAKIKSAEKRKIKLKIYDRIGEQKIDLVVAPAIATAFHRIAAATGVEL
jgi:predicted nucleotidyltransferase